MKGTFEGFIIKSANWPFFISREGRVRGHRFSLQEIRADRRKNFLIVRVTQVGGCVSVPGHSSLTCSQCRNLCCSQVQDLPPFPIFPALPAPAPFLGSISLGLMTGLSDPWGSPLPVLGIQYFGDNWGVGKKTVRSRHKVANEPTGSDY